MTGHTQPLEEQLAVIGFTAERARYRALTDRGVNAATAVVEAKEHAARVMRRTLIEASSK